MNLSASDRAQVTNEANLIHRLRSAVQFCKGELGMQGIFHDHEMVSE
jgi:hypothetical protein